MPDTPYNTGNPVGPNGSDDPRDLVDNARVFDLLMAAGANEPVADRLGVNRKSWATLEVDAGNIAAAAEQSAADAAASAAEAENVKDIAVAAFDASNVYETIALGRAAVADGEFFWVRPGGSDGLATPTLYRRDSSTTQTLVYEQPTIGPGLTQVPSRYVNDPEIHALL